MRERALAFGGLLVCALALASCGESRVAPDDGSVMTRDAGMDAPMNDGGVDAAPVDAGLDASTMRDGGIDAGRPLPPTCAAAEASGSHYGCEHWIVDLDNAALGAGRDASAQPFGITVTNPGDTMAEVSVERSTAPRGATPRLVTVARLVLAPRESRTLTLGRFEVDGSSAVGSNDGTHTALTTNGLRVTSTQPITVVQENPIATIGTPMFSNGTSLVLPAHALGTMHTIVGWPQTIADSRDPAEDFDTTRTDEDMRAFLTIVGTREGTSVTVRLGALVRRVLGAGSIPESGPGDTILVTLGAFEVLNLETSAFRADFSGTRVTSSAPVAVFSGSEAADVPSFDTIDARSCCSDHLEVQLPPDTHAGRHFVIARAPLRSAAVGAGPGVEPQWVRIVPVGPGSTVVTTSLDAPLDRLSIAAGDVAELEIDVDCVLDADAPVLVLHALPSQQAAGIPADRPGGDPALFWIPAIAQHASDYAFAVPGGYRYDALTIAAPASAVVTLDGEPLPDTCAASALGTEWMIRRCPLSDPAGDGFHTLSADAPFGAFVTGFDAYVSHAYAVGATLAP